MRQPCSGAQPRRRECEESTLHNGLPHELALWSAAWDTFDVRRRSLPGRDYGGPEYELVLEEMRATRAAMDEVLADEWRAQA